MGRVRHDGLRRAVEVAQRHPSLYQVGRTARLWAGRHLARPLELPGVPGRVHPNDLMMAWAPRQGGRLRRRGYRLPPPERAGLDLLGHLGRALAPGGILLFTIHGEKSLGCIEDHGRWLGGHVEGIVAEVASTGCCYRPYPYYRGSGYGLAWHSSDHITDSMASIHGGSLALIGHLPPGPESIQDAFVYQRR